MYPHMRGPPCYLSQFSRWSQAEWDLKAQRLISFHLFLKEKVVQVFLVGLGRFTPASCHRTSRANALNSQLNWSAIPKLLQGHVSQIPHAVYSFKEKWDKAFSRLLLFVLLHYVISAAVVMNQNQCEQQQQVRRMSGFAYLLWLPEGGDRRSSEIEELYFVKKKKKGKMKMPFLGKWWENADYTWNCTTEGRAADWEGYDCQEENQTCILQPKHYNANVCASYFGASLIKTKQNSACHRTVIKRSL